VWCARRFVSPEAAGASPAGTLADDDWREFMRQALRHSFVPLAWRALDGESAVPALVAADLHIAFESNAQRNLRLAGELVTLTRSLARAGIEAASWKGPVLAERGYGDLRLRQFFDLDLLILRRDLRRSIEVLSEHGYAAEHSLRPQQQDAYVDAMGELEMVRASDGQWVELHTAIVPTYFGRGRLSESFWERLTSTRVARASVPALDPVDEMQALCVHGSKHRWERLSWIVDIAMLGRTLGEEQWRRLRTSSREHGVRRMVDAALLLAHDVCAAQIPEAELAAARRDPVATRLAASSRRSLFSPDESRTAELRFHVRMWERRSDQLRYLFNIAATPSVADWQAIALPAALQPLYLLVRPLRMVRGAVRGARNAAEARVSSSLD
jgi:hypothetical protein